MIFVFSFSLPDYSFILSVLISFSLYFDSQAESTSDLI